MERKMVVIAVLVVVILGIAVVQTLQITGMASSHETGASSTGAIDMTGWTADEKMNYEMHGIIPARAGGGSSSSGTGMVGGC